MKNIFLLECADMRENGGCFDPEMFCDFIDRRSHFHGGCEIFDEFHDALLFACQTFHCV